MSLTKEEKIEKVRGLRAKLLDKKTINLTPDGKAWPTGPNLQARKGASAYNTLTEKLVKLTGGSLR